MSLCSQYSTHKPLQVFYFCISVILRISERYQRETRTHVLTDFVQITGSGTDSVLSVDRDGLGTKYALTQIAILKSVTDLTDESALVASGTLLV